VALGYAGGVGAVRTEGERSEAWTALLLVVALAAGVILASDVFESGASVDRLLFGTLLGLDTSDLALSAGCAVAALLATLAFGRVWAAVGFDPEAAGALGLRTRWADAGLLVLVALAAVAAIPAVGALLVSAVFILPAASARLLARSVHGLMALAVALALAEGVVGLYLAYWLDAPPGPPIAVLGAVTYVVLALGASLAARRPEAVPA
jgi:ABC-type Mn2+/Zn2+ transport system permease subunit